VGRRPAPVSVADPVGEALRCWIGYSGEIKVLRWAAPSPRKRPDLLLPNPWTDTAATIARSPRGRFGFFQFVSQGSVIRRQF
jgi:hypothetical protein